MKRIRYALWAAIFEAFAFGARVVSRTRRRTGLALGGIALRSGDRVYRACLAADLALGKVCTPIGNGCNVIASRAVEGMGANTDWGEGTACGEEAPF